MTLSDDLKTLVVPENTGATAQVLTGSSVLATVAARFLVTLPPPTLSRAERVGFLRSWQAGSQAVVARLFDPTERVDESAVRSAFLDYQTTLAAAAQTILGNLGGGWAMTVFQLTSGALQRAFELSAESTRSALLYLHTAASGGVGFHGSAAADLGVTSGDYDAAELQQDYVLRAGAFQAVVALGRSGLLDGLDRRQKLAGDRAALGLGPGVVIVLAVLIIAAAVAAAWIAVGTYEITTRNETVRKLAEEVCRRDPRQCEALVRDLSSQLTQPPPGTLEGQLGRYALLGVAIVAAIYTLPKVLEVLFARGKETR